MQLDATGSIREGALCLEPIAVVAAGQSLLYTLAVVQVSGLGHCINGKHGLLCHLLFGRYFLHGGFFSGSFNNGFFGCCLLCGFLAGMFLRG